MRDLEDVKRTLFTIVSEQRAVSLEASLIYGHGSEQEKIEDSISHAFGALIGVLRFTEEFMKWEANHSRMTEERLAATMKKALRVHMIKNKRSIT